MLCLALVYLVCCALLLLLPLMWLRVCSLVLPLVFLQRCFPCETKYSLSEIRTRGVFRGAKRRAWMPAQISDLGTVCLTPGGPPHLPNTMEGAKTSVKSRTATPQPQRRSTGSLEKGLPVPSRNMIKQLLFAHSSSVSQELCVKRTSTTSQAALGSCLWSRN